MKAKNLVKIIKSDAWWSEESPGVPLFCQWMQQFVEQSKYWHPKLPNIIFCFIKNDFIYEETPEKQKLQVWDYVLKQYQNDSRVQQMRYKQWLKLVPAIKKEGEYFLKHGRQIPTQEFIDSFSKVVEILREHWRFTWVLESADVFTNYHLPKLIQKEKPKLSLEQATAVAINLTAPTVLSFMENYQIDLLKFAIAHYSILDKAKKLPTSVQVELKLLARKYVWLLSNYKEGKELTWQQVWAQLKFQLWAANNLIILKTELKQLLNKGKRNKLKQVQLYKELSLSNKLKKSCELLSWWSRWIDERKQVALLGNWYLEHYAQEAARRLRLEVWQVKYMLPEEIVSALVDKKNISVTQLRERRKLSLFLTIKENGHTFNKVIVGVVAQKLWQSIFSTALNKEIKGQVASAPVHKINGIVQIVLDPHKDKFTTGRILVTTMTRPDFVPLIRRAKAIICDEGGITSHAAIISRELGVPCIIGTKTASKQLTNGVKIEVDFDKGVVHKIT